MDSTMRQDLCQLLHQACGVNANVEIQPSKSIMEVNTNAVILQLRIHNRNCCTMVSVTNNHSRLSALLLPNKITQASESRMCVCVCVFARACVRARMYVCYVCYV